ncbi:MAG: Glu/Leu/Phe/Val dehydrogenase [Chloroflexi bacterium]|nr:Glu/Leu/Phe/Val dehydrogenase [Chloroflexota bacterium]
MLEHDYEQLVYCTDKASGLRAFICIHDTTLGPALGGVRIWPHKTEEDALTDVLRLARAMTYKAAAAGISQGGGKALIIADPRRDKSEALFKAYGRFVESLGGRYITAEDVGCTVQDLEIVATETRYVTGLPVPQGGSGDPSIMTGYGVCRAMQACAQEVWGNPSLQGKTVAIQGFGKVASNLAAHLRKERARLVVADINEQALDRARREYDARIVPPSVVSQ